MTDFTKLTRYDLICACEEMRYRLHHDGLMSFKKAEQNIDEIALLIIQSGFVSDSEIGTLFGKVQSDFEYYYRDGERLFIDAMF